MEEERKRFAVKHPNRMRNLKQYKNLTDDEYAEVISQMEMNAAPSFALEDRIERKLKEFEKDYDLTDLKINDMLVLRALIQAILQLEDLEQAANKVREEGILSSSIAVLRELNNMMVGLRKDISSMQEDLKITRKHRKGDKEANVISYLEDLKIKAKQFYEEKMSFIFCPKCSMLLGTVWTMYPDRKGNVIKLTCRRDLGEGKTCDTEVIITPKELLDMGGTNKEDIPESLV